MKLNIFKAWFFLLSVPFNGNLSAQVIPDISTLDNTLKGSIKVACSVAYNKGPAAYSSCLMGQLEALKEISRIESLKKSSSCLIKRLGMIYSGLSLQ